MLVYYIITGGRHPYGDQFAADEDVADANFFRRQLECLTPEEADMAGRMLCLSSAERPHVSTAIRYDSV